ncbi:MAG: threonine--tRNA ligase [Planctomycetes bacterium]|jgi:threonyl-tRNA synthetase|nr:threonine--tRNA ligase [Planctomycetota bacterium]
MENQDLEKMRHSLSHVMAAAVKKLYPGAKFAIGPAIDNGFYYDIDFGEVKIGEEDLKKIEAKMKELIKADLPFARYELDIDKALAREEKAGEIYKYELIEDLKQAGEKKVSYYRTGEFEDLCRGPHVKASGELSADGFKLEKLAGAYWRGSEKNKMLTRIYGLAFSSKAELKQHLLMLAEAEKRNHVKLGRELGLFSLHEEGPGFPFFHPKGMIIWQELMKYWKEEHDRAGYLEVKTPIILKRELWERSGHWDHYKENMYFTRIDETDFAVKPMNCPGGILYYQTALHSYRELPLKVAEIGLVHRHELSGVLNGLFRVRAFHQDDAHIYCTEEQVKAEVVKIARLIDRVYSTFGLTYHMELSTRPDNSIGSEKMWATAEAALKQALDELGGEYKLNPGDGAFYGPKIDFHIKDAIGRTWQCGTIQCDFAMPERFTLAYTGADSKEHRPVMLHRVVYGAMERFLGVLIEHFAGAFPVWLAPVQAKIISVGSAHIEYCHKLSESFYDKKIRVEVDDANETVGNKIRKAAKEKIPYVLVIGDKEMESGELAVRDRATGETRIVGKEEFITEVRRKIDNKEI